MTAAVITTSQTTDFHVFARPHASALRHSDLIHYVCVPPSDVPLVSALGRRTRGLAVVSTKHLLPRHIVTTERLNRTIAKVPPAPSPRWAELSIGRCWPTGVWMDPAVGSQAGYHRREPIAT